MQNKKIVEYNVLSYLEESKLRKQVNAAIARGWQPYGPISMSGFQSSSDQGETILLVQTMVKYAD